MKVIIIYPDLLTIFKNNLVSFMADDILFLQMFTSEYTYSPSEISSISCLFHKQDNTGDLLKGIYLNHGVPPSSIKLH